MKDDVELLAGRHRTGHGGDHQIGEVQFDEGITRGEDISKFHQKLRGEEDTLREWADAREWQLATVGDSEWSSTPRREHPSILASQQPARLTQPLYRYRCIHALN